MSFSTDTTSMHPTENGVLHLPAGEGLTMWVSGDSYTMKATAAQTGGSLGFVEAVVPPGGGPVAHAHAAEDEAFYLLDGELEFLDGDRTFVAEAGSFVFIPRTHRHRFKNVGTTDARTLFLFTPGGPEALFVEGGDTPVPGGRPTVWDMDRIMQVADIAQRTGMTILPEES